MKQFSFILFLFITINLCSQNYITSSVSTNIYGGVNVTKYSTSSIIRIYDSIIYHITEDGTDSYLISNRIIKPDETIYTAYMNNAQYIIKIRPREIIFRQTFTNKTITYYYEIY